MSSPLPRTSARRTSGTRTTLGALVAVLASLLMLVGSAGSASAEDGYRYWNYSHLEGDTFAFAQTGPGDTTPKDGSVEGWRYGTSTVKQGVFPRADLSKVNFDAVCGDTDAAAGEKRVAVLVDFGTEADADGADVPDPRAECAVVPKDATGQQVLESVVDVRADKGMICALDGYPAKGCGEPVGDAQVSTDEQTVAFTLPASADDTAPVAQEDEGGVNWVLIGALALVVVLAAVAVPLYRRNRDA
jgi:hypothetical protein